MSSTTAARKLEELHVLKCSLLPGEQLVFVPRSDGTDFWGTLLESYADDPEVSLDPSVDSDPIHFQLKVERIPVWLEVELHSEYGGSDIRDGLVRVTVRGANMGRTEQERWNTIVKESIHELQGSECVLYPSI